MDRSYRKERVSCPSLYGAEIIAAETSDDRSVFFNVVIDNLLLRKPLKHDILTDT